MYEVIQHEGDGPVHPLNYAKTRLVKPFQELRDALDYWKAEKLYGSDGYFLVVIAPEVPPTAMRLGKEHFV